MESVGKIGGNVVNQIRALEKILLGWGERTIFEPARS
jgi:hypothetical protein